MPFRVFLNFEGDRHELYLPDGATVSDMRQQVKNRFLLGQDDGKPDKKVVVLNYLGADLKDEWNFQDIGVMPGATIKISEREEKRPRLYVLCSYNNEKVKIMDPIEMLKTTVAELRSLVSRQTGLPVGVFRLTTDDDRDLYDLHTLDRYDLEIGDTIHLHTWDGWTDFLNLCRMGYTSHVFAQLSDDDLISRYQMKVAMHIGCYHGHIDLVTSLMKHGVRADDPVGYHPYRQWCNIDPHIDSLQPPIHECAIQGQTACLRTIVNHNICTISCKNGNEKSPFQVALKADQKACAGFLLGKQWSRIQYGPPAWDDFPARKRGTTSGSTKYRWASVPLNVYSKLKNWCERAKDRNYLNNGPLKSTLKRRPYLTMGGTLVGLGVIVDGYTPSTMNGKSQPPPSSHDDRSFLLPKEQNVQPKDYFKKLSNTGRGGKQSRAKIAIPPTRGIKGVAKSDCILEEESSKYGQDSNKLEEIASDEELNMSATKPFRSREAVDTGKNDAATHGSSNKDEALKLPQLDKGSKPTKGKDGDGNYIETGKEGDKDRAKSRAKSRSEEKKERMVISAMKKAKVQTVEYSIPLPLISNENTTKPYLQHCRSKNDDPALSTLELYEKYRGLKSREYAIKCLSIASNFKDKPWLQQVQLAMDLTSQEVKKIVNTRAKEFRKERQRRTKTQKC